MRGTGHRGRRPLQVWWARFCGYRTMLLSWLVSSTGERCSPLPWGAWLSKRIVIFFYSIFKLRTRCRKCFSVRSETSPRPHLFTPSECFLMHCYLAGYSIWDNILGYGCFFMVQYTLILIPKIVRFVALKMQQLMECCQIKSKIICLHKSMLENLYRCTMRIA